MWMMMRTLKYLMTVLFSTAFILGMDIHPVSAQESPQEPPPFEFAQTDTLSLSWEDLQEQSAGAEVLNNRTNELKLTVKISSLEPEDPDGEPLDPSQVLEYDPSLSLPSAGSAKVPINAGETRPALGVYDGSLTVSQASLDTVARRSVQLTVEDPQAKETATPLVDKWGVRAYHWVPVLGRGLAFFDWPVPLSEQFLPLDVEAADANNVDPMRGERLGVVTGSQGGAGVVTSTGETKELLSGTPGLKLGFAGLRRPGTYEGQVDFNPDDEDTVALTIDVKDVILWPILALGFGIWFARQVKRYINKGRKVWTLGERTDRLAVNFDKAQERFAKDTQGKPYASYTISQDMSRRRYDLAHNLKRLNNSALVTLDESDESYKAVVEELGSVCKS